MDDTEAHAWYWRSTPKREALLLSQWLTRWRVDPVLFAFEALRVGLTPYQAQILLDLADAPEPVYALYGLDPNYPKRQVLVPSGHGLGKTRVGALVIWWHMICFQASKRLCTAPSADQLTRQLMGEINKLYRRLKRFWPDLAKDWDVQRAAINHKNPDWRDWQTIMRTARPDRPEALQGSHALDEDDVFGDIARAWGDEEIRPPSGGILMFLEEASGIPDSVRKTLQGSLSEPGARLLAPGNPTRADGWFASDIDRPDIYAVHHLDCRLSDRDSVYELPWRKPDGKITQVRVRGFVDRDYWRGILKECDGDEEADYFRVRVRGLKPRTSTAKVLRTEWLIAAEGRDPDPSTADEAVVLGLDFGAMSDKHAIAARRGSAIIAVEEWLIPDNPEGQQESALRRAIEWQEQYNARIIVGDSNGVGAGVMSMLSEYFTDKPVSVIHFSAGLLAHDARRYYRRRDEMWYRDGRKFFSDPRCSIPTVPGLIAQLAAPGFEEDTAKRIKVQTKKEIRKATGQESGNAADAVLMTLEVHAGKVQRQEAQEDELTRFHPAIKKLFDRYRVHDDLIH